MKKNVASQVVGAEMVSAADGSAFTGAVTCYVTGDGGTQAAGSVGAGACTHEGNGFHTYAPAQAETNYDHIAFTFTGAGAIPATVQVYTSFPQTGDNYARLGAPAGASISADIAGVQSDTNDIQTRLPAALVGGRMDSSVGAVAAGAITAAGIAAGALTNAKFAAGAIDAAATANDFLAEVNAEVVDALNVDTYAEPGQEAPGATISLAKKIGYIYKFLRNKITQTSTTFSVYNDDAATVDQKAAVSDDGTTFTRGEIASGP